MKNKFELYFYYWLFKIIHQIIHPPRVSLDSDSFKNILIFTTAGIGDALTDSPAIRAIKETHPDVMLTAVVHKKRSCIARHNPYIDNVVEYRKGFFFFLYLWAKLKKRDFDAVVILRANDPDIWPLAYLIKPDVLISNPKKTRFGFLVSHPAIVPGRNNIHRVEQTLVVVKVLNVETKDKRLVYDVTEDELHQADMFLARAGIDKMDIVAFQIGGGKRLNYRNWSWQNYARLGKLLLTEYDIVLLLLGGKEYRKKGNRIVSELEVNVLNLAGRLSLELTAAILKRSRILVTTDTGIMHLGFAVGIETMVLLHYRHPRESVGPYGYGDKHIVIQLPSSQSKDATYDMNSVSPVEVYKKLRLLCEREGVKKI